MSQDPRTALVVFSGGQDSTACLAWALSRYSHVETIGFDYGQRHKVELDCRGRIRTELAQAFPIGRLAWAKTTCSTWVCWARSRTPR